MGVLGCWPFVNARNPKIMDIESGLGTQETEKYEYREHFEPCTILPGSCWFLLVPAESDVKIVILYLVPYNLGSKYLFSNTF